VGCGKSGTNGQGIYVSPGKDLVIVFFPTVPATELMHYGRKIANIYGEKNLPRNGNQRSTIDMNTKLTLITPTVLSIGLLGMVAGWARDEAPPAATASARAASPVPAARPPARATAGSP
jgi:hypothetical protein